MKILQIGKFYYPHHGGMETVLQNLAEGLVKSGHEVTVLCASDDRRSHQDKINGVRILREACIGSLFSQPILPALPLSLARMARNFDLLHFHVPNPLAESVALPLVRSMPTVVTYHADIVRQRALKPFYKPLLRAFLKGTRAIVTPTENHYRYSDFISDFESRCSVIPFGIDASQHQITPRVEDLTHQLQRKHGRFALFVGRLVGYKGLPYLIDAMARVKSEIPDFRLVVIGQGPLHDSLQQRIGEQNLGNTVRLIGRVEDSDELNAYYNACEMFVLPSVTKAEAFGMVLLEAMAFGKPLITTKIPSGVCKVNEENVTGLHVPPENPNALFQAIRTLASDTEMRNRMGKAAKEHFDSTYTLDRMISSYQELYTRITQ